MPSDEKVANELRRLPLNARERVWADLSGNEHMSSFRNAPVEDYRSISASFKELAQEIDTIQNKDAFVLAQMQTPTYVDDRSFRLMFLRSCDYDGKQAAKLITHHMERKRQLFGDERLGRDITIEDLSDSEVAIISSGGLGFLEDRDAAGRAVLLSNVSKLKFKDKENLVRRAG